MKRTLTNMLRLAFHCNDGAARNGAGCCYNSPEETDPSLRRGSTQCFYVRKFTRKATRISPLALAAMNGDHDGDILQGYFIFDARLQKRFRMLEAHYDAHSTSKPGKLNNTTNLPDNTVITLFNWLDQEEWEI